MELFKAHRQWASRPDDERFNSLKALYEATKAYRATAAENIHKFADLRVEARNADVVLVGKANIPAHLTHWSFGQLCTKAEAPASYLRELPATLACQNLNYGLSRFKGSEDKANLLFHQNGGYLLRSVTTDSYTRIWNFEVAERLLHLENNGWKPATPDFNKFDDKLPLYASDRDMFVFLSNKNITVTESGSTEPLYKGVIVENSEVGASSLKLTRFMYRKMCGNHIIWDASEVVDISIRHIGDADKRWAKYVGVLREYANESVSDEEAKIKKARVEMVGKNKEEVLDNLFGKRSLALSRKTLEAGYDAVNENEDGSPNSKWGIVQGLTRFSQSIPHADERTRIDRSAGKIMECEF